MTQELEKLRIHKSHKVRPGGKSVWPWMVWLLLMLIVGGVAWKFRKPGQGVSVETMRVRVPEMTAQQPNDLVALNATGYIMAAHKIELASKVIGRVAWVGVEMGDKVAKGQVLVRLEDDDYKTRVAQQQGQLDAAKAKLAELQAGSRVQEIAEAEAQYARAKAESDFEARDFDRFKNARTSTPSELDTAESKLKTAAAQTEIAKQQMEMLKAGTRKEQIDAQKATVLQLSGALDQTTLDLANTVIVAPVDSTILERNVEVGEFVTNGFVGDRGAKGYVVSLADLNNLLVELDISQNDFAKVAQDQPCWVTTDAYPDRKYDGMVQLISPVANRQKATVLVRVKVLSPDDKLKPDMNATVSFLSPRKAAETQGTGATTQMERPPIRVPASAVRSGTVFVVEEGKVRKVAISVGMTAANGDVEVRKGLIGGEDLILHPPENLNEGDSVTIEGNKN